MDEAAVLEWKNLGDAVKNRDAHKAEWLLKQGGYVDYTYGSPSRSLLMIAAEQGDLPTVKVLLHAGADVLHAEEGETALTLAKKKQHTGVTECLEQAELRAFKQEIYRRSNPYLIWNGEVERKKAAQ